MAEPTDSEINAAIERGNIARQTGPCADAVRYDRRNSRIIVDLTNGCTFAFPPRVAQGLDPATDEDLAAVEILGAGYGLHCAADVEVAGDSSDGLSVFETLYIGSVRSSP